MGASTVMAKPKGSTSEELVVERLEIIATEQPGGTEESGEDSPGTGAPGSGDGGGENAPWHQDPEE
jgi:hypothetical protein